MKLLAPAKVNLFLHVRSRRVDGYHELVSLMCPFDLCDTLTLAAVPGPTTVVCRHPLVPETEENLACRAADLFFAAHPQTGGVRITIEKRIPVGAGLGGGSSDAAAVLKGLNRLFGHPFSKAGLRAMAAGIGADVPFFIDAGPALATGIGERLVPWRSLPPLHVVVVFPGVSVSTAAVYKNLNLGLTKCQKQLRSFLLKKEKFSVNRHLCNDLEPVTVAWYPVIETIKNELLRRGAQGALMAGSGSAVFGLFEDAGCARKAVTGMAALDESWQVADGRLITTAEGEE